MQSGLSTLVWRLQEEHKLTSLAASCSQLIVCHLVKPDSFMQVHEMMGVTEKVPRVGGRELDLHMLYRYMSASNPFTQIA
jgi:hypothetical protein